MTLKFKTKFSIAYYLIIVTFITVFISMISFQDVEFLKNAQSTIFVGWIFLLCTLFLLIPPLFNACYLISDSKLFISAGLFKKSISLDSIVKVSPVVSTLATPFAFSFDRVRIYYVQDGNKQFIDISPKEKSEFKKAMSFAIQA